MNPVCPYGAPRASGLLKSRDEDFIVDETLGFEPSGDGEHLFLRVEKTGLSTPELIDSIARSCKLHPRQIGHSGLKDKRALTRQWLSLHLPGQADPEDLVDGAGYRILERSRHRSKLRPGTHKTNRFEIRLREVEHFSAASRDQLRRIDEQGFANYFGRQRFGREGDNVAQALRQLGRRKLPRQRRSLLISALRSDLFNQVLTRRIERQAWEQPLDGDRCMLDGSHSLFSAELDQDIAQRYASLDIHATASLYGAGENRLRRDALALEQGVIDENSALTECLDRIGSKRQMRALRARAESLEYEYDAGKRCLLLHVCLPAGSYVTSLLDHFIETRESA